MPYKNRFEREEFERQESQEYRNGLEDTLVGILYDLNSTLPYYYEMIHDNLYGGSKEEFYALLGNLEEHVLLDLITDAQDARALAKRGLAIIGKLLDQL